MRSETYRISARYIGASISMMGFDKEDGHLIEGESYHQVVAVLDGVQKGEVSKRQAGRELDTSRPTIDRAIDQADLYGL